MPALSTFPGQQNAFKYQHRDLTSIRLPPLKAPPIAPGRPSTSSAAIGTITKITAGPEVAYEFASPPFTASKPRLQPPKIRCNNNPLDLLDSSHGTTGALPLNGLRGLLRNPISPPSSSPPPTTPIANFPEAATLDCESIIPSPQVFQPLSRHTFTAPLGAPFLPSVTQAAIHLELIECFWWLKHRVTVDHADAFDVIFGREGRGAKFWVARAGTGTEGAKKDWRKLGGLVSESRVDSRERERERVWRAFVELAVGRFEAWWGKMDRMLSARESMSGSKNGESSGQEEKMLDRKEMIFKRSIEASREKGEGISEEGAGEKGGSGSEIEEDSIMSELPANFLPPLDILMVWYSYTLNPSTYFLNFDSPTKNILWDIAFPWSSIHSAIDSSTWTYSPSASAQSHYTSLTADTFCLLTTLLSDLTLSPYPHPTYLLTCSMCADIFSVPISDPLSPSTSFSTATALSCPNCNTSHTRAAFLKSASPTLAPIDATKSVLAQTEFWNTMHHHLWIRSPSLSGKAYANDIFAISSNSTGSVNPDSSNSSTSTSSITSLEKLRPTIGTWLHPPPAGTLERAISRLRNFILSRGHPTALSLPPDVDLIWRTLALSPSSLSSCDPQLTGKRLINLASCRQINIDRKKAVMAAKKHGPVEWERCLCWTCEATRTERSWADGKAVVERAVVGKDGWRGREVERWRRETAVRKVGLLVGWFAEEEERRREGMRGLDKGRLREELRLVQGSGKW